MHDEKRSMWPEVPLPIRPTHRVLIDGEGERDIWSDPNHPWLELDGTDRSDDDGYGFWDEGRLVVRLTPTRDPSRCEALLGPGATYALETTVIGCVVKRYPLSAQLSWQRRSELPEDLRRYYEAYYAIAMGRKV